MPVINLENGNILMFNHYISTDKGRITSYSFIKEISYDTMHAAKDVEKRLTILKKTKFDYLHIPQFEFERNGSNVKIHSEFIHGYYNYKLDLKALYKDLVTKEWTFDDPKADNFITCKRTEKVYIVDLDSFTHIPNFEDRKKCWVGKFWPKHTTWHTITSDGIITL